MKPWERNWGGKQPAQNKGGAPWQQDWGGQQAQPYGPDNPMPGAEGKRLSQWDIDPQTGQEVLTPWWMQGTEYDEAHKLDPSDPLFNRPQFLSEHIDIPTNMEGVALTGQALGRGAADVIGAPGDLANMFSDLVNKGINAILPKSMEYAYGSSIPGSDAVAGAASSVAEGLGYPVRDPNEMSPQERSVYETIRFGSGAGLGGAGMASRAARVGRAAEMGQDVNRVEKALTAPYMERPVRQVADDIAAGAGAGYAHAGMQESYPDSPLADIAGTMLGGMGGSLGSRAVEGIVKAPFNKARNMTSVTLPDGSTESRRTVDDAAKLFYSQTTDPVRAGANLRSFLQSAKEGGMTPLTTGVAADDVGLAANEVRMRAQNSRPFMEKDQRIRTDISKSVNALRDPNADTSAPQKLAARERDRLTQEATEQADAARANVVKAEGELTNVGRETEAMLEPVTSQQGRAAEASRALDEQIGTEGVLGERTKAKNKAFDEAAGDEVVSAQPIARSVEKVQSEMNAIGIENSGLPADFVKKVKALMPDEGEVGTGLFDATGKEITKTANQGDLGEVKLRDVSRVRMDITSAMARAKKAGNYDLLDNLSTLKRDINDMVDNTASFDEAQKYYREEYAPFFAKGYGKTYRDTVQKSVDRTGKADPGRIAEIFLNGTPDAASDLKRIIDVAPDKDAATDAVRRYMAADLARMGGNPSPRRVAAWIKNRSAQLDQFPEIKSEFEALQRGVSGQEAKKDSLRAEISRLSNDFSRAEKNVAATRRRVEKGVLGTLVNADPDKYVKNIMGGDDRLQKLDEVNKLIGNDKDAQAGFKRAVTEHLLDTVTGSNVKMTDNVEGPIQYAQIAKVMKNNEDALAKVYSGSEMNAIRRAQKMLSQYGNLARRGTVGSDTAEKIQNQNLAVALETALRVKFGVLKTGGIMKTVKGAARLLPEGRVAKADRVVAQAMLDPELAIMLLDTPVGKVATPEWNAKLTGLIVGAEQGREDDEN